jgi:hypothetical protein
MSNPILDLLNQWVAPKAWTEMFIGIIGKGDNTDPRKNPETREVWYYVGNETNRVTGSAILHNNANIVYDSLPNLKGELVWIGKPPGTTEGAGLYIESVVNPINKNGASAVDQAINAAAYPSTANLQELRVLPTTPASKEIFVSNGGYTKPSDGSFNRFFAAISGFNAHDSVATAINALTSGQHQIAWICLDYATGKIKVVAGTAVTAVNTVGTAAARQEFINTAATTISGISVTSTYKRILPLYLYYGQTQITEDHHLRQYDARLEFPLPAAYSPAATGVYNSGASTDNAVPRFVGTSGTQIENTGVLIGDTGALTVPGTITLNIGSELGIFTHANDDTRTYTFPNVTGTIALTSDITTATALAVILAPGSSTRNVIQPSGDFKALVLKNNASQTANIFEHHPSGSSTPIFALDSNGGIQASLTRNSASSYTHNLITLTNTGSGSPVAFQVTTSLVANTASNLTALAFLANVDGRTANTTISTAVNGLSGRFGVLAASTFTTTVAVAAAIEATSPFISNAASGVIAVTRAVGVRVRNQGTGGASGVTFTTVVGIDVEDQTNGTNSLAIRTNAGDVVFNEGGAASIIRFESDNDANNFYSDGVNDRMGFGTSTPATKAHVLLSSAATNAITNVLTLGHNGGVVAAGFGTGLIFEAKASSGNNISLSRIRNWWTNVTNSSGNLAMQGAISGYYNTGGTVTEKDIITYGVNGSGAPLLSFFTVTTPVVQQASGANLTNNVTSGGTDDTIANFTDLTVYANDAATIRNDIYQLSRKVKQLNDGLRTLGMFT